MTTEVTRHPAPAPSGVLSLGFLFEDLHRHGDQSLQLIIRRSRQERLGPEVVLAGGVSIEQPAQKRDQCDALELRAAARVFTVVVRAKQRLEPMRVSQRLRRERRDDLAEPNVALGERLRFALGAQENRADDRRAPTDRYDDDRAHVAQVERSAGILQHWIVRRVGDEHRVARLECALELRVPVEIDDEVADRRVLVARDEPHVGVAACQVDRAPIEPERFAELARDRLQDVYEVERGRDVLENVDDGDELVTLALKLRDPLLQPGGRRIRWGKAFDR